MSIARNPTVTLWILGKLGASHAVSRYPGGSLLTTCMIHACEFLILWGSAFIAYSALFDERFSFGRLIAFAAGGSLLYGMLVGRFLWRRG